MDGRNYFREIKKYYTLKKIFHAVKHSNLQRIVFQEPPQLLHRLFLSAAISLRFLYICQ